MKRILKIGVYRPGDLTSEVIALDDVNTNVNGNRAVFTGHATVKSRFKGQDFIGFYQLSKVYTRQQEQWQVIASRTTRIGDDINNQVVVDCEPVRQFRNTGRMKQMSYIRKSGTNILAMIIGVAALAAMAVWQFYLFAKFKDAQGVLDAQGGGHHFWWGLGAALLACVIGFFVFSVFLRYDTKNELHITS